MLLKAPYTAYTPTSNIGRRRKKKRRKRKRRRRRKRKKQRRRMGVGGGNTGSDGNCKRKLTEIIARTDVILEDRMRRSKVKRWWL